MPGSIYLTPTEGTAAVELSRTMFRKKILPMGSIDYKGRKINFDRDYLTDLATAFHDGAYDQTAFMLADASNAHTMDPERYRGEVRGVEVADDGLYATFELSSDAAEMVKANPKLGVSARIVENYRRSDGKTYPRAMQHVLGTLDPRIPGLGAWEEVSLSSYDPSDELIDLTAAEFEGGTVQPKQTEEAADSEEFTDEEYAQLLAELDAEEAAKGTGSGAEAGAEEPTVDEPKKPEEQPQGQEPAVAQLSNEDRTALDLANEQVRELKRQNAEQRFESEKREYVANGVPPALVELARPVLTAPDGFTIDLSNGDDENGKVDAAAVVRQLLDSSVGYIELAKERGHSLSFAHEKTDGDDDPDAEMLRMWGELDGTAQPAAN